MGIAFSCDRCGVLDRGESPNKSGIVFFHPAKWDQKMVHADLCRDCLQSYKIWWDRDCNDELQQ